MYIARPTEDLGIDSILVFVKLVLAVTSDNQPGHLLSFLLSLYVRTYVYTCMWVYSIYPIPNSTGQLKNDTLTKKIRKVWKVKHLMQLKSYKRCALNLAYYTALHIVLMSSFSLQIRAAPRRSWRSDSAAATELRIRRRRWTTMMWPTGISV